MTTTGEPVEMFSYADEARLVSLRVPVGWEGYEVDEHTIRFFGPEHAEHDGYQPTISIAMGVPEDYGDEWFDEFAERARMEVAGYSGFELGGIERYQLSSLVPVHEIWYRWVADGGLAFSQVQALIPADRYRMYVVNAATLTPLAPTYEPIFRSMIRSIRLLPAR